MLFKAVNNIKAEEIRKYISVNSSISFASLLPYIESAEQKYIKQILGSSQYLELSLFYDDPDSWGERPEPKAAASDLGDLLKLAQKSLINLAFLDGFSVLSVNIGDSGAFRKETESQKSLYQYQEEALKYSFRTEGFNSLDAILEFLEDNIDKFPIFKDSDTYTVFKSKFIKTAPEFNKYYNINDSRLVFLHLQKYIELVNDFSILPVIGRQFFDELLTAWVAGETTDPQDAVIRFIQKIQIFLSISRGLGSLGVDITYNGAYFLSHGTNSSNFKKRDPVSPDFLHTYMQNALHNGNSYIDYMKDYLHENIDEFPTYALFYGYNEGDPLTFRQNTDKKTFWT
ncbi:MAG: DUF6712 family protein [Bacteroidales bacterium]|nr:DUF6712 family protein [Bacteroidales bacterium]